MRRTYGDRIKALELENHRLNAKIDRLINVNKPYKKPHTSTQGTNKELVAGSAGMCVNKALLPWNDTELTNTDVSTKGDDPNKALNCHTHSRYSGGALIVDSLELVEYDIDWDGADYSKYNLGLWSTNPPIAKAQNSDNENVDKIGVLDCVFNADTKKWGITATGIDVKNTYLVLRDANGAIQTDAKGNEMKSPLYNTDPAKSSVVWDANAQVWRFYAVYVD